MSIKVSFTDININTNTNLGIVDAKAV